MKTETEKGDRDEHKQIQAPSTISGIRRRVEAPSSNTAAARSSSRERTTRFYERHLLFDNVIDLTAAGPRERFEAVARSVRDVLSQRWVRTEETYERENPKRVYYLSMEFLIGRSLANNVTNLLLDPVAQHAVKEKNLDWLELLEQEPDAGLGNGGLGRLAACFLDSMATMQLPAMGYGLRYEYGIFKQTIQDGWQHGAAGQLAAPPGPVGGRASAREGRSEAELLVRAARRDLARRSPAGRPRLIGIPFDRPVVGYGGKTINTLRLWAAAAPDYFDFQEFSRGDFVGALAETLDGRIADARALSRRLHEPWGRGCASCRSIFWSPARWPISCGASGAATPTGARFPRKSPSSSTTRTRRWPSPS